MARSPDRGNSCRPSYDQHPSTGGIDDQTPLKEIGSMTPIQNTCLSFHFKRRKTLKTDPMSHSTKSSLTHNLQEFNQHLGFRREV